LGDAPSGGEERDDRCLQLGWEPGGEQGGALLIDALVAGLGLAMGDQGPLPLDGGTDGKEPFALCVWLARRGIRSPAASRSP